VNKRILLDSARCALHLLFPVALSAQPYDPAMYQELRWRMIGPFRGGRTVAISGVPGQPNVFYMAPNNGGVWKTTTSAAPGIRSSTISPPNDRFDRSARGRALRSEHDLCRQRRRLRRPDLSVGDGMYKSTDAGRTWQHLGLRDAQQIASIIVDPKDPNRLFVAAQGHPYGPNTERGVYRSLMAVRLSESSLQRRERRRHGPGVRSAQLAGDLCQHVGLAPSAVDYRRRLQRPRAAVLQINRWRRYLAATHQRIARRGRRHWPHRSRRLPAIPTACTRG
jgi:hypothetical protein